MRRPILLLVGLLAIALGILWVGQGSGYIAWPASSFMISQRPWIWWGLLLAAIGIVVVVRSRR
jgi:hypothetical protein